MLRLPAIALAALLFAFPAMAQMPALGETVDSKERLQIGMSTSEIAITSDFHGADLTIFGTVDYADELLMAIGQYDIVVALEGPKDNTTVRKKERLFGIWVNRRAMTFEMVPESYSISSTRAVDTIAVEQELNERGVGLNHIPLRAVGFVGNAANLGEFRDAYRRLKQTHGLYERDPSGVRFVSPTLFRATLRLPANIPNGVHTVRAFLFKSGVFVGEQQLPLRVVKTGIEQAITDAARETPLAYGLFAVLMAIITGWSASILFRKD